MSKPKGNTMLKPLKVFVALTPQNPEDDEPLALHFVNETDEAMHASFRQQGYLDLNDGPWSPGRKPHIVDLGLVSAKSTVLVADGYHYASDFYLSMTFTLRTERETREEYIRVWLDRDGADPKELAIIGKLGRSFGPEPRESRVLR